MFDAVLSIIMTIIIIIIVIISSIMSMTLSSLSLYIMRALNRKRKKIPYRILNQQTPRTGRVGAAHGEATKQ